MAGKRTLRHKGAWPVRILHCHSTFSLGGKEARAVRLMNAFGDAAEHIILSAMPDQLGARDAIARGISGRFPARRAAADRHARPACGCGGWRATCAASISC